MDYFKTTGKVEVHKDVTGRVIGGYVGTNKGSVYFTNLIHEYFTEGNFIHIDKWGRPWVKR